MRALFLLVLPLVLTLSCSSNSTSGSVTAAPTPSSEVTTWAGQPGAAATTDGLGTAARFIFPQRLAITPTGTLYVGAAGSLRKVDPSGQVSTLQTQATNQFQPYGLFSMAADAKGNLYAADPFRHVIRCLAQDGSVRIVAGVEDTPGYQDGSGPGALFSAPLGLAVDSIGRIFVADSGNHAIRLIDSSGQVSTFAGTDTDLPEDHDGVGGSAGFYDPSVLALDGSGNLYVLETQAALLRKVSPSGVVTTLAGQSLASGSVDGAGSAARFNLPQGLAVDAQGNILVADTGNQTLRWVSPEGLVTTLAGFPHVAGSADGQQQNARFYQPSGLASTSTGFVLADSGNDTLRTVALK